MKPLPSNRIVPIASLLLVIAAAPIASAQEPAVEQSAIAEDQPAVAPPEPEINYDVFARVEGGRFILPALAAPTTATDDIGNGRRPEGFGDTSETPTYILPESASDREEAWNWSFCHWAAANTFSNPRYFEDRMLERHGHQRFHPCVQPLAAGGRFFLTVPMLPYLWTARNPCDCEYTLGYYRPGSRTPGLLQRPPLDRTALIVEAATLAGICVGFP